MAKLTNSGYFIVVSDNAANVSANFAALNSLSHLSSITLTDAGTPTLTLKAAQALGATIALGKITNTNYAVGISDIAAAVSLNIDGLNDDSRLASVNLTDSGTPVLSLTAAQASADTFALSKIKNAGYVTSLTTIIKTDGPTSLTQIGNLYFLNNSSGVGPALLYQGSAVTTSTDAIPIGAVQVTGGYDVAWKFSNGLYSVWFVDNNGNYVSPVTGGSQVAGTNTALEVLEPIFYQDLNGDGVLGTPQTTIEATGNDVISVAQFTQAAVIDAGASLELTGAGTSTVSFKVASGTLIIDHAALFSGQVVGLAGDGTLAHSNAADLRDVVFSSAIESYSGDATGGLLTVGDGRGDIAHILLGGNYTNSTFNLVSDGKGGTLVVDPPNEEAHSVANGAGASMAGATDLNPIANDDSGPSKCDSLTGSSATNDSNLGPSWLGRIDAQLHQLVQAMASQSTSDLSMDTLNFPAAQVANEQARDAIGAALH